MSRKFWINEFIWAILGQLLVAWILHAGGTEQTYCMVVMLMYVVSWCLIICNVTSVTLFCYFTTPMGIAISVYVLGVGVWQENWLPAVLAATNLLATLFILPLFANDTLDRILAKRTTHNQESQ